MIYFYLISVGLLLSYNLSRVFNKLIQINLICHCFNILKKYHPIHHLINILKQCQYI
jgi:hypothetical protein